MKRTVSNFFVLLFASLGLLVSIILTYKHYRPETDIGCGFERSGCSGILNSTYGELAHIPTALFGAAMYLVFIGLALRRAKALNALKLAEGQQARAYANTLSESDYGSENAAAGLNGEPNEVPAPPFVKDMAATPRAQVKQADMMLWGLAATAFCISWWLQYTAIFVLLGFCPWCFASAILVTLLFLTTSWDFLIDGRTLTGEHKLLAGVGAFILVLLAFMYGPTIRDQYLFNKMPIVKNKPVSELTADTILRKETHLKGDPNAPVTIVEFADYECPTCARAVKMMDKALADHPHDFRVGFRNMPLMLTDHKWNKESAAAAEAAAMQGKFWEMHDLLFQRQEMRKPEANFQPAKYDDWAQELGLNVEQFHADRENYATMKRVQKDAEDGANSGILGTPTFFIIKGTNIRRIGKMSEMKAIFENRSDPLWQKAGSQAAAN